MNALSIMDGKLTTLTPREIAIKCKLVEATKAVKKKMRAIKMGEVQSEAVVEKTFKLLIVINRQATATAFKSSV